VIAHIGALPLEELLPVLTGAGSGLLAVRAWIGRHRLPRRGEGEWWWRRHDEYEDGRGGEPWPSE
jgi:hypothetical protein